MATQNLITNVITFDPPCTEKVFAFTTEKKDGYKPLSKWECMFAYKSLFQASDPDFRIDYLYTDFSEEAEGAQSITMDLTKSIKFAKHYYTWLIHKFFKEVADITEANFVKDIEIWFALPGLPDLPFNTYKSFTIKVQVAVNTEQPEMIISYDSTTMVHKKSILELDFDTTTYSWVVFRNAIYHYDSIPQEAAYNLNEVFPVLNNEMKYAMGIPAGKGNPFENKYKSYKAELDNFIARYIRTDEFRAVIPVGEANYLTVDKIKIKNTTPGSNLLEFGQKKTDINPYNGLIASKHGPFENVPHQHINVFVICHESHIDKVKQIFTHFSRGYKNFPPLNTLLNKPLTVSKKEENIVFQDISNPIPEIKKKLAAKKLEDNVHYLAIYFSPISKHEADPVKHKSYFLVKEELLKYKVTSQVIDIKTVDKDDINYSLVNIGIAILAKFDGIPWRLSRVKHDELVIGVGAFKSTKSKVRYVGSAFCFTNFGHFRGFECYAENNLTKLATSISKAIIEYRKQNQNVSRLIIHFYKTMSRKEFEIINYELKEMKLDIPIITLTINKTESKDLVIFDLNCPALIPVSGTFIRTGFNQFLLCNNTRYETALPKPSEGYPFPIKIKMNSTHPELLDDSQLVNELIDQVYQFSRMYWKSVRQQNLPVTIKYPEMVAEIFPHFDNPHLDDFGKNNLWFL